MKNKYRRGLKALTNYAPVCAHVRARVHARVHARVRAFFLPLLFIISTLTFPFQ